MKSLLAAAIIALLALTSCQPAYYYHFPNEKELHAIKADSVKWRYSGKTIVQVPVSDSKGTLHWLDVNDKTKVVIKTVMGEEYRFYLRSIETSENGENLFGSGSQWTGYDVREHVKRTVAVKDIGDITVQSEAPAGAEIRP